MRLIFQLRVLCSHPLYNVPLAFVYWFSDQDYKEMPLDMYSIQYRRNPDKTRVGGIVRLSSFSRLVQLVPVFGSLANPALTSENSMDEWRKYYINPFMDKESYQSLW